MVNEPASALLAGAVVATGAAVPFVAATVAGVLAAPPGALVPLGETVPLAGFGVSVALLPPQAARIAVAAPAATPPRNPRRVKRRP